MSDPYTILFHLAQHIFPAMELPILKYNKLRKPLIS